MMLKPKRQFVEQSTEMDGEKRDDTLAFDQTVANESYAE